MRVTAIPQFGGAEQGCSGASATWGERSPPPAAVVARNWGINRATIIGSVDVILVRWHLVIKGARWHRQGDKEWLGLPSREWVGKDDKRQFADLIAFVNDETAKRFRDAALAAIKTAGRESAGEGS
jgi:hypothetical protein